VLRLSCTEPTDSFFRRGANGDRREESAVLALAASVLRRVGVVGRPSGRIDVEVGLTGGRRYPLIVAVVSFTGCGHGGAAVVCVLRRTSAHLPVASRRS
jgi:hypothetical protein